MREYISEHFVTNDFNDKFFIAFLSKRKKNAFFINFVLGIIGEFQIYPEQKWCLKPVLLLHSPFLLPFFLGGKRKRVRNNQLPYKTGYIWNSPVLGYKLYSWKKGRIIWVKLKLWGNACRRNFDFIPALALGKKRTKLSVCLKLINISLWWVPLAFHFVMQPYSFLLYIFS